MRAKLLLPSATAALVMALAAPVAAVPDPGPAYVSEPLAGVLVAVDPGHQRGNYRFPALVNRSVPAGGQRKACNSTGTATTDGVAESTVVFEVASRLQRQLERLGARVIMTRHTDSLRQWGPCVDDRGRFGNHLGADLKISLHADGGPSTGSGFHVIAPAPRPHWTRDIAADSARLAHVVRRSLTHEGFDRADYTAGGDGLSLRTDLATLNLSDVPVVMVELANLRNPTDARALTRRQGQARYAGALMTAVRLFTGR